MSPALTPAEARVVAEILSWPDGPWDFFGCESVAEWRALVATANKSGVARDRPGVRRADASLPGMDVGKKAKVKKARA